VLPILTILICLAADITVRRDGFAFQISGDVQPGEVTVFVGKGEVPPVLGKVVVVPGGLSFEPRFEIPRSIDVRVVVRGKTFHFPAETRATVPSTKVNQVYPTSDKLPANQLKFYIEFSAPMLNGEAWQHLQLLDQQNKPIDLAFLEIDQELWDRDRKRLTVLFDPGRIKRGVLPRDEIGAALEAGKSYTLQISPAWRDEERMPLVAAYRKVFTVVEEDRTAIDPKRWTVSIPSANSRMPLVIEFHEPLDSALALRLISLPVAGIASLGELESTWSFTPDAPWAAGTIDISIDTALEDLAGNKVGRPFDVDTFNPITVRSGRGIVTLPIRIR
jgi:hypothetical protein